MVTASTLPTKFPQSVGPPNPVTTRNPPSPPAVLTIVASASPPRAGVKNVLSGLTLAPGPLPAVPLTEYQPPLRASHVCQVSSAGVPCGLLGKNPALW